MPLEKKPPRFVPTLTEVVPGKLSPAHREQELVEFAMPAEPLSESDAYAQVLVAAQQYMAQRMPELVAQHMAACEAELRQEVETVIKKVLAGEA